MLGLIRGKSVEGSTTPQPFGEGAVEALAFWPAHSEKEQTPLMILSDRLTPLDEVIRLGKIAAGLYKGPTIYIGPIDTPTPNHKKDKLPGDFECLERSDHKKAEQNTAPAPTQSINILAIGDKACSAAFEFIETQRRQAGPKVGNLHLADTEPSSIEANARFLEDLEGSKTKIQIYRKETAVNENQIDEPSGPIEELDVIFPTVILESSSDNAMKNMDFEATITHSIYDMKGYPEPNPESCLDWKLVRRKPKSAIFFIVNDIIDKYDLTKFATTFSGKIMRRLRRRVS